jgi:hypothetical protein
MTTEACPELGASSDTSSAVLQRRAIRAIPLLAKRAIFDYKPVCALRVTEYVRDLFKDTYIIGFSLVPLCLFAFLVGILATNHIYSD